jgi:serine/threonine protein kinase
MDYQAFRKRYQYNPSQRIGKGGFGSVYKAFDTETQRTVAIKISPLEDDRQQFTLQREFELVKSLKHSNVVQYEFCDCFETDAGFMEHAVLTYYPEGDLEDFLTKNVLNPVQTRQLIRGILTGLQFLHHNHIIHRDFKARNILIANEHGGIVPKITDFGLGRSTDGKADMTNTSIGITYAYAAPEQFTGARIHLNVDLWALGVVLYRIVARELPFGSYSNTMTHHEKEKLNRRIINVELPEKLDTLPQPYQQMIRRCLVGNVEKRAQVADELLQLLDNQTVQHQPAPPPIPKPIVHPLGSDTPTVITPQKPEQPNNWDKPTVITPQKPEQPNNWDKKTVIMPQNTPKTGDSTSENQLNNPNEPDNSKNRVLWWGGGFAAVAVTGLGIWFGRPKPPPPKPNPVAATPALPTPPAEAVASLETEVKKDALGAVNETVGTVPNATSTGIDNKAGTGTTKPSNGTAKPSNGTAKPSNGTAKPSNGTAKPNNETTKPSTTTGNTTTTTTTTGNGGNTSISPPSSNNNPATSGNAPSEPMVYDFMSEKPKFGNGKEDEAFIKYLKKNLHYPTVARDNHIEGRVYVSFVVNREGGIEDVKQIGKGLAGGCTEEAIRVLQGMPKWTPGKYQGRPVKVIRTYPISFKLE